MDKVNVKKGLEGVVVDTTAISKVVPETNSLTYRGYSVQYLCAHHTFEEVAHLLLQGNLPSLEEKQVFNSIEKDARKLDDEMLTFLKTLPLDAHPMDNLRSAISYLGAREKVPFELDSQDSFYSRAIQIISKTFSLVAALYRMSEKQEVINAKKDLSLSENFFWMCFGKIPSQTLVNAFDASLILYAEHSFNASTFTARVITSTTSDCYSALTGAIGALKGPLHGGANEQVMYVLKEIGDKTQAQGWLQEALAKKRKIMGFGHRVYKKGDSRVPTMKEHALNVAKETDNNELMEIAQILEEEMIAQKGIHPNLDFPAGPAYYMMGFPIPLFTPIFVMSRMSGWLAHIYEQQNNNRLIRPLSEYNGKDQIK